MCFVRVFPVAYSLLHSFQFLRSFFFSILINDFFFISTATNLLLIFIFLCVWDVQSWFCLHLFFSEYKKSIEFTSVWGRNKRISKSLSLLFWWFILSKISLNYVFIFNSENHFLFMSWIMVTKGRNIYYYKNMKIVF